MADMRKIEMRQHYRNLWHTDLTKAITSDPVFCCFALWCGPCASYWLRRRALYNNMSRYTCCGGYMPCSGHCGERNCPEFCLCTEVFLCFANSVASTRFMIQDEFNIQTTQCDNCIIGFMFCLQQLACIFSIIACIVGSEDIQEASQLLDCLADLVYCTVCPCMQTQHKVELDKRDGRFGPAPARVAPPVQQMSRMDQPLPAPVGYPPPPTHGYYYPPPPQAPGYPPPRQAAAYPPHPQGPGYPPHPQAHSPPPQAQGFPSPPQAHGYPPSPQAHAYPPPPKAQGFPSPPQAHGYPPSPQAHAYPPSPQAHAYPPPPQAQGYPPANYPPPPAYPPPGYTI